MSSFSSNAKYLKYVAFQKSALPAVTSWRKTKKRRRRREDGPPWQLKRRGGAAERATTGPDTQLRT
jgi:hypothetical protein